MYLKGELTLCIHEPEPNYPDPTPTSQPGCNSVPTIVYVNKTVEVEVQVPWYTYRLSRLEGTWGSLEFAHCELNFTISELRNRYKSSLPPNFKIGGLGPLTQAGVYEVWVCIEDHYCSNHPVDKVSSLSSCESFGARIVIFRRDGRKVLICECVCELLSISV